MRKVWSLNLILPYLAKELVRNSVSFLLKHAVYVKFELFSSILALLSQVDSNLFGSYTLKWHDDTSMLNDLFWSISLLTVYDYNVSPISS